MIKTLHPTSGIVNAFVTFFAIFLTTNLLTDNNRSPEDWQKMRQPSDAPARPQGTHTNHTADRYQPYMKTLQPETKVSQNMQCFNILSLK